MKLRKHGRNPEDTIWVLFYFNWRPLGLFTGPTLFHPKEEKSSLHIVVGNQSREEVRGETCDLLRPASQGLAPLVHCHPSGGQPLLPSGFVGHLHF